MEQNVTKSSVIIVSGSSSMAYIMDSAVFLVSMVGMVGNSVAMFIMTSSVKIRKSRSYVLLMNQCLLDFTVTMFMIPYLLLKYVLHWSNMSGSWDLLLCHVIYSQLYSVIPLISSNYNLVALSVERMTSVVWPVFHKVRCTRKMLLIVAVITWVLGLCLAIATAFPVNGINTTKRKCYFWNNFPSRLHSQIYSIMFNSIFVIFPIIMMLTSYAMMYASISSRRMRTGVKLNVARMLLACIT